MNITNIIQTHWFLPSHKLSAGKNATPIRVPIVAPIVAMMKSSGECRKTAKFMMDEAIKSFTAQTWPIESAIPMPTCFQSMTKEQSVFQKLVFMRN